MITHTLDNTIKDHLVRLRPDDEWQVLKGSEDWPRFPDSEALKDIFKGVQCYGTKLMGDRRAIIIRREDISRANELGWTMAGRGKYYGYMVRM